MSRNQFQTLKQARTLYFTYVLTFPDGETWIKQRPFVHSLEFELKQMIAENKKNSEWRLRATALWKAGECWWKDNLGVEHLIVVEARKRPERWGINKEGMGTFSTETGK